MPKICAADTSLTVSESLSPEEVQAGKIPAQKSLFIPKGTDIVVDLPGLHFNRKLADFTLIP